MDLNGDGKFDGRDYMLHEEFFSNKGGSSGGGGYLFLFSLESVPLT